MSGCRERRETGGELVAARWLRRLHKLYAGLSFSRNILTLYLKLEQKLTKVALTRGILTDVRVAGKSTFYHQGYQRPFPIDTKETSVMQPNTSKLPSLSIRPWYVFLFYYKNIACTFSFSIVTNRKRIIELYKNRII